MYFKTLVHKGSLVDPDGIVTYGQLEQIGLVLLSRVRGGEFSVDLPPIWINLLHEFSEYHFIDDMLSIPSSALMKIAFRC